MAPRRDVLGAVDSLVPTEWTGTAFRHTAPGRSPLQGHGAYLNGGRWNPRESFSTIYLAAPVEACVAEFARLAGKQARGLVSFLPRDLFEIRASGLRLLDLQDEDNMTAVGLSLVDIESEDWTRCQEVGAAAFFLGLQGIAAPSATGLGVVIAVFESRVHVEQVSIVSRRPLSDLL